MYEVRFSKASLSKIVFAAVLAVGLLAAPSTPLMQSATAQSTQPATPAETKTKIKKPPSASQIALRERQKKCGAEWKEAKAAGKVDKGMKWPQYWSVCNKRLRSGG